MSKQTKRVDSLSTGTLGIRMSLLELESRKLEPVVKKDDNVDMECCASDRSQNDPLTFSNSCQKSKRSHQKRKLAVRADRKISLKDAAHAYLQLWHSDRSSWQFRKKIQFWLLKNMYAKDQVDREDFKILLLYLEDLKGNQREKKIDEARSILDIYEQQEDEAQSTATARRKCKRAIEVLRVLV